ncbi:unnamed protein product [Calypogeia fissa]
MIHATGIDSLIDSMEDLDPSREKAPLIDLVRGPLSESVKALERLSHDLPTGHDFHFYSNFREFRSPVADVQSRVVSLLSQLGSLKDVVPHASPFPTDVDEGYDWLVGVQDALLERVDASLEKFYVDLKQKPELNAFETSSRKSLSTKTPLRSSGSAGGEASKAVDVKVARGKEKSMRSPVPFHIPSIPRPQDRFDDAVDNSNTPFRHRAVNVIRMKSAVSGVQEVGTASGAASAVSSLSALEEHARKLGHKDPADNVHPLQEELTKMAFVEGLLDTVETREYESLDDTPFTFVTTLKALKEMAYKLRKARELAIDLENHHYRSYQGFVCLMQVSTRKEDFIVDTLDLRSQIGPCLGDIFADPTIRKVMHGADRDIVWLQRDFGIYVCNLFDTGQAARVLQLPGFGLAFLLEHFCKVHADKRYQLADWRIRPLPAEMIKYAREDTHYLLYVHDMLKQLLLDARATNKSEEEDPLIQVYTRSRDLCLQLYAKEIFTETSYQNLYGLQDKKFRAEQLAALAALYSWRDSVARKGDESTGFVLPNHLLLQLASEMPEDVRQLQSFVRQSHSFVSRHANSVIEIIRQAKERALRELEESNLEPEEGELKEESPRKDTGSDEKTAEVSNVAQSLPIKVTALAVDKEDRMETRRPSKTLQSENLVTPMEASTPVRMPGLETLALATTGINEAGYSLTDARSGDGQSKLTSDVSTGPVVVSRKTTSSLFGRKSGRTTSVPLPSSNVPVPPKAHEGTSEAQDTQLSLRPVATDSSLQIVDQPMPDACSDERVNTISLGEEQGVNQAQEISVAVTSIETAGAVSATTVEAVDREGDEPFTVPEFSPLQTEGEAKPCQIEVNATLGEKSIITASVVPEKGTENAPIIQAKRKPSKLGALLGGRKKVQQASPSESVKDGEQARMKTQNIESSMVLPFGPPATSFADSSTTDEQTPFGEEAQAIAIPEQNLEDCNGNLHEETTRPIDEETSDRPSSSTTPELPDVLMLDTDADGDLQESSKHRKWWPPMGNMSGKQRKRDSKSPHEGPSETAHDQQSGKPDGGRNPDIPISISEMHRNSQRRKKGRSHSEASFNRGNSEVPAGDFGSGASRSGNKKRKQDHSLVNDGVDKRMASTDNMVGFSSFNYREARDVLGLDNLFTEQAEDRQGTGRRGRGRGSKKDSKRPGIPLSKTAFDPLRRTREEPRPEGIKPGQRRQVFPQSGNRTAVFKQ